MDEPATDHTAAAAALMAVEHTARAEEDIYRLAIVAACNRLHAVVLVEEGNMAAAGVVVVVDAAFALHIHIRDHPYSLHSTVVVINCFMGECSTWSQETDAYE